MSADPDAMSDPRSLGRLIRRLELEPGPEQPCPYLPGRAARVIAFRAGQLPAGLYHSLMDLNFRRSGDVFYRPVCDQCRQCQAIRVPVETFRPDRSQRRCRIRNRDLTAELADPDPTAEKHALFQRYLNARHDRQMSGDWESFRNFLYASPNRTMEVTYRHGGALLGVGLFDLEPRAASTVYCYFEPDAHSRSLGTFNVLWTLDFCRRQNIPYVYLGYFVRDCRAMNYKTRFQPCELLDEHDRWQPIAQ